MVESRDRSSPPRPSPSDSPEAAARHDAPPPRARDASEPKVSRPPSVVPGGALVQLDPAAAEEALQKNALAEFTRQLVQTMNRTTYYDPGHPAHFAVRDELFELLRRCLHDQPQIGYLLQRGRVPEILVDGATGGRVKLSELIPEGAYEIFVPRFIEYFDRFDLVTLAFRQGIGVEEFGQFVAVVTRPPPPQGERPGLSRSLVEAGVLNVSALAASDLGFGELDMPWQIRVCLARLRRDLRTIPFFRHVSVELLRRAKLQIFQDVVRPIQSAEELRLLVMLGPRIERELEDVEEVRDVDITEMVVEVLVPRRLVDLSRTLVDAWSRARSASDASEAHLREALEDCATRLLRDEVPDRDSALRLLHSSGVVAFERLPEELRDWLLAEKLDDERRAGGAHDLPHATRHDLHVLGKLGRLSFLAGRIDDMVDVVETLKSVAAPDEAEADDDDLAAVARWALSTMVTAGEVDDLAAKFEASTGIDAERYRRVLRALGKVGVRALAARIARAGAEARFGPVFKLLEAVDEDIGEELSDVLLWHDLDPHALRVLLAIATRRPDRRSADAAAEHVRHADPQVRRDALAAMLAGHASRSVSALKAALDDESPEIVAMALATLAEKMGFLRLGADRALALVSTAQATPQIDAGVLAVALRIFSQLGAEPERDAAIAAVRHFLQVETRPTGFLGLTNRPVERPELVAAAKKTLADLGVEPDTETRKSFFDSLLRKR